MYWSFSDVICRMHALSREHTIAEARRECVYNKKCSNYFKSRHLAFMNNLVSTTWRRHAVCKSAVLNSSPRTPPRSAHFVCYSYRFRCLFYSNASALRSGHHRIFPHDSIQSAYKCARREFKWYTVYQRYMMSLSSVFEDVAQRKSWMNDPN